MRTSGEKHCFFRNFNSDFKICFLPSLRCTWIKDHCVSQETSCCCSLPTYAGTTNVGRATCSLCRPLRHPKHPKSKTLVTNVLHDLTSTSESKFQDSLEWNYMASYIAFSRKSRETQSMAKGCQGSLLYLPGKLTMQSFTSGFTFPGKAIRLHCRNL